MKQTFKPYTLVGPTVTRPEQDPPAVVNFFINLVNVVKKILKFQDLNACLEVNSFELLYSVP